MILEMSCLCDVRGYGCLTSGIFRGLLAWCLLYCSSVAVCSPRPALPRAFEVLFLYFPIRSWEYVEDATEFPLVSGAETEAGGAGGKRARRRVQKSEWIYKT